MQSEKKQKKKTKKKQNKKKQKKNKKNKKHSNIVKAKTEICKLFFIYVISLFSCGLPLKSVSWKFEGSRRLTYTLVTQYLVHSQFAEF